MHRAQAPHRFYPWLFYWEVYCFDHCSHCYSYSFYILLTCVRKCECPVTGTSSTVSPGFLGTADSSSRPERSLASDISEMAPELPSRPALGFCSRDRWSCLRPNLVDALLCLFISLSDHTNIGYAGTRVYPKLEPGSKQSSCVQL